MTAMVDLNTSLFDPGADADPPLDPDNPAPVNGVPYNIQFFADQGIGTLSGPIEAGRGLFDFDSTGVTFNGQAATYGGFGTMALRLNLGELQGIGGDLVVEQVFDAVSWSTSDGIFVHFPSTDLQSIQTNVFDAINDLFSLTPEQQDALQDFIASQSTLTFDLTTDPFIYQPICFTAGTMIATPFGDRPVETLKVGDLVVTRDHGPRRILWCGRRRITLGVSDRENTLRPIRIRAGALGPSMPARDLSVSPLHRIMLAGQQAELLFGESEVLVAAKYLVNDSTIRPDTSVTSVDYVHFVIEDHGIVYANGMPAESLLPGPEAIGRLSSGDRAEILCLFPELEAGDPSTQPRSARKVLKQHEALVLRTL